MPDPCTFFSLEGRFAVVTGGAQGIGHTIRSRGTVTACRSSSKEPEGRLGSGRRGRGLPSLRRPGPEGPKGSVGHEVTLNVEGVVSPGVGGQEALEDGAAEEPSPT